MQQRDMQQRDMLPGNCRLFGYEDYEVDGVVSIITRGGLGYGVGKIPAGWRSGVPCMKKTGHAATSGKPIYTNQGDAWCKCNLKNHNLNKNGAAGGVRVSATNLPCPVQGSEEQDGKLIFSSYDKGPDWCKTLCDKDKDCRAYQQSMVNAETAANCRLFNADDVDGGINAADDPELYNDLSEVQKTWNSYACNRKVERPAVIGEAKIDCTGTKGGKFVTIQLPQPILATGVDDATATTRSLDLTEVNIFGRVAGAGVTAARGGGHGNDNEDVVPVISQEIDLTPTGDASRVLASSTTEYHPHVPALSQPRNVIDGLAFVTFFQTRPSPCPWVQVDISGPRNQPRSVTRVVLISQMKNARIRQMLLPTSGYDEDWFDTANAVEQTSCRQASCQEDTGVEVWVRNSPLTTANQVNASPIPGQDELQGNTNCGQVAQEASLCERVHFGDRKRFRFLGKGVAGFDDEDQHSLMYGDSVGELTVDCKRHQAEKTRAVVVVLPPGEQGEDRVLSLLELQVFGLHEDGAGGAPTPPQPSPGPSPTTAAPPAPGPRTTVEGVYLLPTGPYMLPNTQESAPTDDDPFARCRVDPPQDRFVGRHPECADPPLGNAAKHQAVEAGRWWKQRFGSPAYNSRDSPRYPANLVFLVSPLRRAMEACAMFIRGAAPFPGAETGTAVSLLIEEGYGADLGKNPLDESDNKFPEIYLVPQLREVPNNVDNHGTAVALWEKFKEEVIRVQLLNPLLNEANGGTADRRISEWFDKVQFGRDYWDRTRGRAPSSYYKGDIGSRRTSFEHWYRALVELGFDASATQVVPDLTGKVVVLVTGVELLDQYFYLYKEDRTTLINPQALKDPEQKVTTMFEVEDIATCLAGKIKSSATVSATTSSSTGAQAGGTSSTTSNAWPAPPVAGSIDECGRKANALWSLTAGRLNIDCELEANWISIGAKETGAARGEQGNENVEVIWSENQENVEMIWSECSTTCGPGVRFRKKFVLTEPVGRDGALCETLPEAKVGGEVIAVEFPQELHPVTKKKTRVLKQYHGCNLMSCNVDCVLEESWQLDDAECPCMSANPQKDQWKLIKTPPAGTGKPCSQLAGVARVDFDANPPRAYGAPVDCVCDCLLEDGDWKEGACDCATPTAQQRMWKRVRHFEAHGGKTCDEVYHPTDADYPRYHYVATWNQDDPMIAYSHKVQCSPDAVQACEDVVFDVPCHCRRGDKDLTLQTAPPAPSAAFSDVVSTVNADNQIELSEFQKPQFYGANDLTNTLFMCIDRDGSGFLSETEYNTWHNKPNSICRVDCQLAFAWTDDGCACEHDKMRQRKSIVKQAAREGKSCQSVLEEGGAQDRTNTAVLMPNSDQPQYVMRFVENDQCREDCTCELGTEVQHTPCPCEKRKTWKMIARFENPNLPGATRCNQMPGIAYTDPRSTPIGTAKAYLGGPLPDCNCPVDCAWNAWLPWSVCTASCGAATQSRTRTKSVVEQNQGRCPGNTEGRWDPTNNWQVQTQDCHLSPCPVNCIWGPWGGWSACSKSCVTPCDPDKGTITGYRQKTRWEQFGGVCPGSESLTTGCVPEPPPCPVPVDCVWGPWGPWSACGGASCGQWGSHTRTRPKWTVEVNGGVCWGGPSETQGCQMPACYCQPGCACGPHQNCNGGNCCSGGISDWTCFRKDNGWSECYADENNPGCHNGMHGPWAGGWWECKNMKNGRIHYAR
ncbi:unnamed protein product [Amoebophrya sp. A120]|nr:unnamed protein product [Amoebophrya sp. A120]|eukprot:GSA120T00015454001.1